MSSAALALIAARPLSLRYSLLALVARLPQIASIQSVEDMRSMRALLAVNSPQLVVLDIDLIGADSGELLAQLKAEAPDTRVVVLVDEIQQQQALEMTSADLVVLKGHPAADLFTRLQHLLSQAEH